jgi:predicted nucleotidyltransferase
MDARVAFVLGRLWLDAPDSVRLLGGVDEGTFLVPDVEGLEEAFGEFISRHASTSAAGRRASYNQGEMAGPCVEVDRRKLEQLCRRHHVRRLSLFGSVLREDFGPESDIDVLVEFEAGHTPGLSFIQIERELSALFGGRAVDLVTPRFLNHRIRDRVLAEAEIQYAA